MEVQGVDRSNSAGTLSRRWAAWFMARGGVRPGAPPGGAARRCRHGPGDGHLSGRGAGPRRVRSSSSSGPHRTALRRTGRADRGGRPSVGRADRRGPTLLLVLSPFLLQVPLMVAPARRTARPAVRAARRGRRPRTGALPEFRIPPDDPGRERAPDRRGAPTPGTPPAWSSPTVPSTTNVRTVNVWAMTAGVRLRR